MLKPLKSEECFDCKTLMKREDRAAAQKSKCETCGCELNAQKYRKLYSQKCGEYGALLKHFKDADLNNLIQMNALEARLAKVNDECESLRRIALEQDQTVKMIDKALAGLEDQNAQLRKDNLMFIKMANVYKDERNALAYRLIDVSDRLARAHADAVKKEELDTAGK
jgi:hypothetical protein